MKNAVFFLAVFSLALFVGKANARKDPAGEYWKGVMKDEPIPELLQTLQLVNNNHINVHDAIITTKPPASSTSASPTNHNHYNFDPRPNISSYNDDDKLEKPNNNKSYKKDFEPRPNVVSSYNDDDDEKHENPNDESNKSNYQKDFDPRPNVSSYNDDDKLENPKKNSKSCKEGLDFDKSYYKKEDFEPRPDHVTANYAEDVKEFEEPRPNLTGYSD